MGNDVFALTYMRKYNEDEMVKTIQRSRASDRRLNGSDVGDGMPENTVDPRRGSSEKICIPRRFFGYGADGSIAGGGASDGSTSSTSRNPPHFWMHPQAQRPETLSYAGEKMCYTGALPDESTTRHAKVHHDLQR